MAGYSKIYVIGGLGGVRGSDGVNPIELLILVGDADRQWLEPHYFDQSITPIGKIRSIVPDGPSHPDSLIDACIAFCPQHFKSCQSLLEVMAALRNAEHLDFHMGSKEIPAAWSKLREEARSRFAKMNIWRANLAPIKQGKQ